MAVSETSRLVRGLPGGALPPRAWFAALAAGLALMASCREEERRLDRFERAQRHHRGGEYAAALSDYQAFLDEYPNSPVAPTARQRVRALNRLVQSTLQRQMEPPAAYVGGEDPRGSERDGRKAASETSADGAAGSGEAAQ